MTRTGHCNIPRSIDGQLSTGISTHHYAFLKPKESGVALIQCDAVPCGIFGIRLIWGPRNLRSGGNSKPTMRPRTQPRHGKPDGPDCQPAVQ